ncbi:MAG: hypothetical protein F6J90_02385 [Moorea sp. SIOASIH]|uniref:hypothetical protein n=1 Tax=Moorena sp. SIOASIH TaxID=2607817 RepID=UPI0013B780F5|nr:hypothetical protein [Moorena sp. SIOASIH]NEO35217.1 hypothetical protein [Moorena sp. SIOASIH]NEO89991.1 hypothetical protein [Moorena sp. SIO3G5]
MRYIVFFPCSLFPVPCSLKKYLLVHLLPEVLNPVINVYQNGGCLSIVVVNTTVSRIKIRKNVFKYTKLSKTISSISPLPTLLPLFPVPCSLFPNPDIDYS